MSKGNSNSGGGSGKGGSGKGSAGWPNQTGNGNPSGGGRINAPPKGK